MSVAGSLRQMREINRRAGRAQSDSVTVIIAGDFLHGGLPTHARAFDRKGAELVRIDRFEEESLPSFSRRAFSEAQSVAGTSRVVIGGLGASAGLPSPAPMPQGAVTLPDVPLHPNQREAVELIEANRRTCLVCGRRWAKSTTIVVLAVDAAISGRSVAITAPTYRLMRPLLDAVAMALGRLPGITINRALGEIRLAGGGGVDFWSIDVTQRAGRGRKCHLVMVDEAAHDENDYLRGTLEAALAPATLDYAGKIVLASTPAGLRGAFWECATMPEKGYAVHHAPTSANPHLPASEIVYLRTTLRPEIASQELDAVFLDTAGSSIFPLHLLLEDGQPHADEGFVVDYVGLTIDSNSGKGGPDRDGCAACVFALSLPGVSEQQPRLDLFRVVLLDWDVVSLTQGHVADWIQHVREMAMTWFHRLKPMQGLPAAWVEPMGNAYSIIEVCQSQGLHPHEISGEFVSWGKDNRALHAEPHFLANRVKIGRHALDKRSSYRGITANHLVRQVTGFKTFDKDSYKREDDLLDAAIYAVLVGLGDGLTERWARLKRVA
jgi:hypothetical protein